MMNDLSSSVMGKDVVAILSVEATLAVLDVTVSAERALVVRQAAMERFSATRCFVYHLQSE